MATTAPALPLEEVHKKKGMRISLIIHGIILLLALIPFFSPDPDKNIDTQYAVQIAFDQKDIVLTQSKSSASTKSSSAEGAKRPKTEPAATPAPKPSPRPAEKPVEVVKVSNPKPEIKETQPAPKPAPKVAEPKPIPTPTESEPVEAEIITDESEVVAVEEEIPIEAPEPEVYEAPAPVDIPTPEPEPSTSSFPSLDDILAKIEDEVGDILNDGVPNEKAEPEATDGGGGFPSDSTDDSDSGSGTGDKGSGRGDGDEGDDNDDGIGRGGVGDGEYDDSGDGVFGRKVVHRDYSMVKRATGKSGVIVFTVCIGRDGSVTTAQVVEVESTITDRDILKDALRSLYKYKYEPDPSAPREQCGKYKLKVDTVHGLINN